MRYVAEHTTIPVPEVFEVSQSEYAGGLGLTVDMEFIDGYEMQHAPEKEWPALLEELKGYVAQLRLLRPPNPGRVEAIGGSSLRDIGLTSSKAIGPFDTVPAFHDYLGFAQVRLLESQSMDWPLLDKMSLRAHSGGYRTMFTHGDIAPRNVLVKGGKIVAIIDWENAGWFPEWWESACWSKRGAQQSLMAGWVQARDEILGPYAGELAGYAAVCKVFPKY